jgi:hypothetical protein
VQWSGCDSVNVSNQCVVAMTAAKGVTATFALVKRRLDVTKGGTGAGTVTSAPAGIDCGSDCGEAFDLGTHVTLAAAASAGSRFAGWSGGGCSGTATCEVTTDADQSVAATFSKLPPDTKITSARISRSRHKATFEFRTDGEPAQFECELKRAGARGSFKPCTSPKSYKHLKVHRYTFLVRALDDAGMDATPAEKTFRIKP